jgi:TM2 domain-containing membrane protein YozV
MSWSANVLTSRTRTCKREKKEITMRDPGVAAVLSAIIPGVGQFYNGRFLAGILWLIITPGLWIGTGGLLGWVCHVISAYTATPTRVIIGGSLGNDRVPGLTSET